MNYLIGILAFILMLGVIIVIHEAGHFMANIILFGILFSIL